MSYTLGCPADHVTVSLWFRVAQAMAADQGEQTTGVGLAFSHIHATVTSPAINPTATQ